MVFTQEHKIFLIESYFRSGVQENGEWRYSIQACINEFREKFPQVAIDVKNLQNTIVNTVQLFRSTGSILRKEGSGRPSLRTQETVEDVRQRLIDEPTKSLRKLKQEVGLSYGTCQKILKKDLHLYPYKMQVYQELLPADYNRRLLYCQWFMQRLMNNDELLNVTFYSDEAWFHLSGYVNSQNMRLWSADNPHIFHETPLHPIQVGVWIAVSRRRLIGPIFFEESVTAERYRNNILNVFVNQLHDDELEQGYFQQDGARAHTARETLHYLREFFDDRIISIGSEPEFPPRSPDLTVLDFFIFPHLKNTIFKTPVNTVEDLKNRIREECANITPEVLRNVFMNMKRRVNLCLENRGQHFQQFL